MVYGAGGLIGGAVARAFAREGATVFLAGRTLAGLKRVANEIADAGGISHAAQVNALDAQGVASLDFAAWLDAALSYAGTSIICKHAAVGVGKLRHRLSQT